MEKIFCVKRSEFKSSEDAIERILAEHFDIRSVTIERNENGKPFLKGLPFFVSVSHTKEWLVLAFCDENVGVDAEPCDRLCEYLSIVKKFTPTERDEIVCDEDFLRHWTIKESVIKWLGGALSRDLYKIRYERGELFYGELPLPVRHTQFTIGTLIVSVCSERDFSRAEIFTE